jgi:hypothetical protein
MALQPCGPGSLEQLTERPTRLIFIEELMSDEQADHDNEKL